MKNVYVGGTLSIAQQPDQDLIENSVALKDFFDYNNGYDGTIYAGWRFRPDLRLQAELGRTSNKWDRALGSVNANATGHITSTYGLVGLFYDPPLGWSIQPYIGGSLGLARVDAVHLGYASTVAQINDSDTVFAYKLTLGAALPLRDRWNLTAEYSYFRTGEADFTSNYGYDERTNVQVNMFGIGLRYDL